ncbi:helix-turn-helix domain-containing protein [Methanorbis rubei]|uniref:HTH-type transcriptional regulator YtcD n=1 Tax=Methanorbis rubei TaxID=3028300 RepID=A0AAE4MHF4_9EURY|nr:putative HTH-type transcriptional regulator YtcD [Methanocorpusculaceae archaeon Cs1]
MDHNPPNAKKQKYICGIDAALDIIGGKWKAHILYALMDGTLRYSQIQPALPRKITQRMLTKELRDLEKSGLVTRTVYPEIPPKVEYSLTDKGRSIMPILDQLCTWGGENITEEIEIICS